MPRRPPADAPSPRRPVDPGLVLHHLLDGFRLETAALVAYPRGARYPEERGEAVAPTARILMPLAGGLTYRIDGATLTLRPGHALLLHAGCRRSWVADRVAGVDLAWAAFDTRGLSAPAWQLSRCDVALERACWTRLIADQRDPRPVAREAADLAARAMIARCCAGAIEAATGARRRRAELAQAIAWIEAHLADPDPLAGARRVSGLGDLALRRALRAAVGASPQAYVRAARMRRARLLLQRPGASVAAVAAAVGFADPFHFSRRYRAHWGRAPSADLGASP